MWIVPLYMTFTVYLALIKLLPCKARVSSAQNKIDTQTCLCITVCQQTACHPFVHSRALFLYTFFHISLCHVILFSCCTSFTLRFPCCSFFILRSFHVALFWLYAFHVALFSFCNLSYCTFLQNFYFVPSSCSFFHVTSSPCCTFFILRYFHTAFFRIALFSRCTFSCFTPFMLHLVSFAFFSCSALFMLHFFPFVFFSCCTFLLLQFFSLDFQFWLVWCWSYYMVHFSLLHFPHAAHISRCTLPCSIHFMLQLFPAVIFVLFSYLSIFTFFVFMPPSFPYFACYETHSTIYNIWFNLITTHIQLSFKYSIQ